MRMVVGANRLQSAPTAAHILDGDLAADRSGLARHPHPQTLGDSRQQRELVAPTRTRPGGARSRARPTPVAHSPRASRRRRTRAHSEDYITEMLHEISHSSPSGSPDSHHTRDDDALDGDAGSTYPTPPASEGPATLSDPSRGDNSSDNPNHKDYYPPSAYGPHGRPGYSLRAAHDTTAMAASGFFAGPPQAPSTDGSESNGVVHEGGDPKQPDRREPPPFFSHPPIPVYHNQPQSVASYYPAPHHQAQLLARVNASRSPLEDHPNIDPLLQAPPSPALSPPQPPQPHHGIQQNAQSFLQGGIIYTPSVEELGLHSLSDGPPGEKPPYPYPTIIRCAILGSPRQRLTLSEIYIAMENRYPWFKTAGNGWRNSVRHNLSLNKCFAKVARPITEPGKGAYWTVDLEAGEGNKRPRKRNKKPKKNANAPTPAQDEEDEMDDFDEDEMVEEHERRTVHSISGRGTYGPPESHRYGPEPPQHSGAGTSYPSRSTRQTLRRGAGPYPSNEPEGLVTAASLGGRVRRVPVRPPGPAEEGRRHREDEESD